MEAWLDKDLRTRFEERILAIDQEVADRCGLLTAAARNKGIVLPVIDGLLAATALEHNLTLVTRDTGQIPTMGVAVFNPWKWVAHRIGRPMKKEISRAVSRRNGSSESEFDFVAQGFFR